MVKALLKKLTVGEQPAPAKKKATLKTGGAWQSVVTFSRQNWLPAVVILVATLIFFWPVVTRIDSYSEGGDAMFNAWTLARDQHCIMGQNCPSYVDANIYFPHKDTMLYSETQLSAGLLTLPLSWVNDNPLFSYNIWTIASFFFSGLFMYLLAKHLSKGNRPIALLAGLVFEFAPLKVAAYSHLQNLSVFYFPLIFLLIFKFLETKPKRYLAWLVLPLVLLFYASWYQMAFALFAIGALLLGGLLFKRIGWKPALAVAGVVLVALIAVWPLAKEYIRFAKTNNAAFNIADQVKYSSSLKDYLMPNGMTIEGEVYHALRPHAQLGSYNPDSPAYHGMILYVVAGALVVLAWRRRKTEGYANLGWFATFGLMALVGFVISLGPLLKIGASYVYGTVANGLAAVIPLPWALVDRFLPQLEFIRALGRASVLVLFALCCMLAFLPQYMDKTKLSQKAKRIAYGVVVALIVFELMPVHQVPMAPQPYAYNIQIPQVYKFIKSQPQIDDIAILDADTDYPGWTIPFARAEWVLWAGYHNKNIFNGYSGYTPPNYFAQYDDFRDFHPDDVAKMKTLGIKYVLVDKQLSSSNPELIKNVRDALVAKPYEDNRYALFQL